GGLCGRLADVGGQGVVERWRAMLVELRAASGTDYAMYAVANRELMDLAQSSQHGVCIP
ncbi:hypothetical protein, partial [Pseudomonas aeruginosa]|uniref:hypothetical protein n=1 Tax=Pseudomonas aeruginosa TaxID=287 RepID=UPI003968064A